MGVWWMLMLATALVTLLGFSAAIYGIFRIKPAAGDVEKIRNWERRVHRWNIGVTAGVTAIPIFWQITRFYGPSAICGLLFLPFLYCLAILPLLLVWGAGFSLYVRKAMRSRGEIPEAEPEFFVFLACVLFWLAAGYLFRLLPPFANESGVPASFLDPWLNQLR